MSEEQDSLYVCNTNDVSEGEIICVSPDGDINELAVYNVDGDYFVSDNLCTHGDAKLSEGDLDGHNVVCPFHLGEFDVRTGEPTLAPCSIKLRVYPAMIRDGGIFICPMKQGSSGQ